MSGGEVCVRSYGACKGRLEVFFSGGADLASRRRPEECELTHSCPVLSWLCAVLSPRVT